MANAAPRLLIPQLKPFYDKVEPLSWLLIRLTAGLIAFGISWLTASRILPVITSKEERFSPLSDQVPPK